MKLNEFKEVRVEWQDAVHISAGWQSLEVYLKRAIEFANLSHYTTGFLIEENDDYVIVALDIRNRKSPMLINMAQCIHKNMIISIKELEIKEKDNGKQVQGSSKIQSRW